MSALRQDVPCLHVWQGSGLRGGVGVIGVIECNFLKPAHNKQDFEYTKEYRYKSESGIVMMWALQRHNIAQMKAWYIELELKSRCLLFSEERLSKSFGIRFFHPFKTHPQCFGHKTQWVLEGGNRKAGQRASLQRCGRKPRWRGEAQGCVSVNFVFWD